MKNEYSFKSTESKKKTRETTVVTNWFNILIMRALFGA